LWGIKEQDGATEKEERGAEVNKEIDYMVSPGVVLAKEPVEGKAEVGDGTIEDAFCKWLGEKGLPKCLREEVVNQDWGVLKDVWGVV
jgi:hypothetical protein